MIDEATICPRSGPRLGLLLLLLLLPHTANTASIEVATNSYTYYEDLLAPLPEDISALDRAPSLSPPPPSPPPHQPSTETFASYAQRRRLETGLPELGSLDYLFRDAREFLCQGVNELRKHYTTVEYDDATTGAGPQREYCATNGTELKATIEQGPDEMWVVVPRGRKVDLSSVGSILIRQGQTVHLRANNGTTIIDGGGATKLFVVHGTFIADTLMFVNGSSNVGVRYSWTAPRIGMPPTASGGAVHIAGGLASGHFIDCTFYNNNYETMVNGRDIWNEGELVIHNNNFAPGWDNAPPPVRNDGVLRVTPKGSYDDIARYQIL